MSSAATIEAPRLDLAELVEGLASQPELFSAEGGAFSPEDADLLRAPERLKSADAARFSGRNTNRNEARALKIAALVMLGRSKREICRQVGCDRRVIAPVIERLERAGILPAVETRARRCEQELREETLHWLRDLVDDRTLSRDAAAMLRGLFTGAGILADKQAAAAGNGFGAGGISVQIGVSVAADPGNWRAQVAAVAGVPENESGATRCAATVCEVSGGLVAGLVADDSAAGPVIEVGAVIADTAGEHPGGGVASAAGGPRYDASGSDNNPHRGPEA